MPINMKIAVLLKDVRVHAPITCIKLGIPIYFIDYSEFITVNVERSSSEQITKLSVLSSAV